MDKEQKSDLKKEEYWNFYCGDCKWTGVAQDLVINETDFEWRCPRCKSIEVTQTHWYLGNKRVG